MHSACFTVLKTLFFGSALILNNKYKALRMLFGHIITIVAFDGKELHI